MEGIASWVSIPATFRVLITDPRRSQRPDPAAVHVDGVAMQPAPARRDHEGDECRRFEVPTPLAASSFRNFKSKSGTRIIELLVPLCFRSSCQNARQRIAN